MGVHASVTEAPGEGHHKGDPVVLVVVNLEVGDNARYYYGDHIHYAATAGT